MIRDLRLSGRRSSQKDGLFRGGWQLAMLVQRSSGNIQPWSDDRIILIHKMHGSLKVNCALHSQ